MSKPQRTFPYNQPSIILSGNKHFKLIPIKANVAKKHNISIPSCYCWRPSYQTFSSVSASFPTTMAPKRIISYSFPAKKNNYPTDNQTLAVWCVCSVWKPFDFSSKQTSQPKSCVPRERIVFKRDLFHLTKNDRLDTFSGWSVRFVASIVSVCSARM